MIQTSGLDTVLVGYCGHDKIPQTSGFNARNVFSHSAGGWKPSIQMLTGWVCPEAPLLGLQSSPGLTVLPSPHMVIPACA